MFFLSFALEKVDFSKKIPSLKKNKDLFFTYAFSVGSGRSFLAKKRPQTASPPLPSENACVKKSPTYLFLEEIVLPQCSGRKTLPRCSAQELSSFFLTENYFSLSVFFPELLFFFSRLRSLTVKKILFSALALPTSAKRMVQTQTDTSSFKFLHPSTQISSV